MRRSIDNAHRQSSPQLCSPKATETLIDDYAKLIGPSLLKKTLGLQRGRHGIYLGSSGQFEPALARSRKSEQSKTTKPTVRHVNEYDSFMLIPDQGTEHYEEEIVDLDAIEEIVHPHGKALISLYFRIVHPSFPILHKKVFLEKYERTHREFAPALLAAVYILALNFWTYSRHLSSEKKPDVVALERLALKAIGYAIYRPKSSTVEAGLLLLQRPKSDSWTLSASMVAVGQDLGLHLDCSNWKIPSWERGLRKRLAWALYAQDTWASLVHGRPSHISRSNWAVTSMTESDFPERAADDDDEDGSTEVEKGRLLFCHMVSLTMILADILSSLYSVQVEQELRDAGPAATKIALTKAKPVQIRLRDWYTSLPQSLSIEDVRMRKLSSTGSLHLAYYATEITLHRQIIRTLPICDDPNLIEICRNAARARLVSTMSFAHRLRLEHLQSFWYFPSKFNFALVGVFECLLYATALDVGEATFYMTRLEEYRWILRVSSKSAEFLAQSLATIDGAAKDIRAIRLDEPNEIQAVQEKQRALIAEACTLNADGVGAENFEPLKDFQLTDEDVSAIMGHSPDGNTMISDTPSRHDHNDNAFQWSWGDYGIG